MPALKRITLLALLAGCEGPTLHVGELQQLPELDASELTDDSGQDAGRDARIRDAQFGDARIELQLCDDNDDCRDPRWPRCNSNFFVCTNCQFDRDCKQGEYCDMSPWVWQCRDKGKDDQGPMGGGP